MSEISWGGFFLLFLKKKGGKGIRAEDRQEREGGVQKEKGRATKEVWRWCFLWVYFVTGKQQLSQVCRHSHPSLHRIKLTCGHYSSLPCSLTLLLCRRAVILPTRHCRPKVWKPLKRFACTISAENAYKQKLPPSSHNIICLRAAKGQIVIKRLCPECGLSGGRRRAGTASPGTWLTNQAAFTAVPFCFQ